MRRDRELGRTTSLRLRLGRAPGRFPARTRTHDDIARTLEEIRAHLGDHRRTEVQVAVQERMDGWVATVLPKGVRAQVAIWWFTPDGRLAPTDGRFGRHGWDERPDLVDQLDRWR